MYLPEGVVVCAGEPAAAVLLVLPCPLELCPSIRASNPLLPPPPNTDPFLPAGVVTPLASALAMALATAVPSPLPPAAAPALPPPPPAPAPAVVPFVGLFECLDSAAVAMGVGSTLPPLPLPPPLSPPPLPPLLFSPPKTEG